MYNILYKEKEDTMKIGNFKRIKKDIASGLTNVMRRESSTTGRVLRFFINETPFMAVEFSAKQLAYLTEVSTVLHPVHTGGVDGKIW